MYVLPTPNDLHERIHAVNKRATPNDIMNYNLGIQLFKLYNSKEHSLEWLHLNHNQIITSRQTHFKIMRSHHLKVGLNAVANRLNNINGKITLTWLNLCYESFVVYFDQLLGACSTRKLVETFFSAVFRHTCFLLSHL